MGLDASPWNLWSPAWDAPHKFEIQIRFKYLRPGGCRPFKEIPGITTTVVGCRVACKRPNDPSPHPSRFVHRTHMASMSYLSTTEPARNTVENQPIPNTIRKQQSMLRSCFGPTHSLQWAFGHADFWVLDACALAIERTNITTPDGQTICHSIIRGEIYTSYCP